MRRERMYGIREVVKRTSVDPKYSFSTYMRTQKNEQQFFFFFLNSPAHKSTCEYTKKSDLIYYHFLSFLNHNKPKEVKAH